MKIFLSWSGARSKAVADAFALWLPQAIPAVEPWMSSDRDEGIQWSRDISGQFEATAVGVICLTADNFTSPRILFEAGALAKTNAHVGTFLLDPPRGAIGYPLRHFHHTVYEKDELRRLLVMVNAKVIAAGERGLTELMLNHSFEAWWPRLRQKLDSVPEVSAAALAMIEDREFSNRRQTVYSGGSLGQP
jgi:hypothetical protein